MPSVYEKLNRVVRDMIKTHKGGKIFFDNLDANLQDYDFLQKLYDDELYKHRNIIVSGKFGMFFTNLFSLVFNVVQVPGGLRNGARCDLEYMKDDISGKNWVFVDDSFYSGKTRDVVFDEIKRCGGTITDTFCVYDGSKEKDETVMSLYRYYDETQLPSGFVYKCTNCKCEYLSPGVVFSKDDDTKYICPSCHRKHVTTSIVPCHTIMMRGNNL
jgi:hypothetical protein